MSDSPQPATAQPDRTPTTRQPTALGERIQALDTVRGFALCGIVFINIGQIFHMVDRPALLEDFVYERFLAIFCLLFGVGFGIFLQRAEAKNYNARVLLLRRLLVLAVVGGLHQLLQPGEALLPYAVGGLIFLLPLSFLPRRVIPLIGIVLLSIGAAVLRGYGPIPGLLIIGFAVALYGGHRRLPRTIGLTAALFLVFGAVSVVLFLLGGPGIGDLRLGWMVLVTPIFMAGAYICAVLLLLHTRLGPVLNAVLSPLGRMALTNYLMATLLIVSLGRVLDLEGSARWTNAALLGAGILVGQAILSPIWLRHFAYGPMEWFWRCATYGQRFPIRKKRELSAPAAG